MHVQREEIICALCASTLSDLHAIPDINRLPWSSQIRQIHCLIWLHRAQRSQGAVRKTCTQVALTEGGRWEALCCRISVNVSLGKLQVTDWLIYFPSTLLCTNHPDDIMTHASDNQTIEAHRYVSLIVNPFEDRLNTPVINVRCFETPQTTILTAS